MLGLEVAAHERALDISRQVGVDHHDPALGETGFQQSIMTTLHCGSVLQVRMNIMRAILTDSDDREITHGLP